MGQRHYLSLGFADTPENRKLAEMKAREIELDILSGHFDQTLTKYKPQSALFVSSPDITPKVTPSLPTLWQKYSEAKQTGKSPTVRMYGWVANHLERGVADSKYELRAESPETSSKILQNHTSIQQRLRGALISRWQRLKLFLIGNVPANSTKRLLMHLAACCKWAKKGELIDVVNPFEGMAAEIKVKKSDTEEDEVNPFTREERDRIITAFKTNRHYKRYAPLVEFLFFTGCRPSEAIALQWQHINNKAITFSQAVIYNGKRLVLKEGLKTQKLRRFPINAGTGLLADDKCQDLFAGKRLGYYESFGLKSL